MKVFLEIANKAINDLSRGNGGRRAANSFFTFFSGLVQARESIVFWPLEVIEEDTLPLLGMVAMQALW